MITLGLVVKLTPKPGCEQDLADFLHGAADLARDEATTPLWLALQGGGAYWIVDAFADADGRNTHLGGPIAAGLMANAERLLACPPELTMVDVLAAKGA